MLSMQSRLRYDDVAWEKSEAVADEWARQFFEPEVLQPVGNFLVRHHRPGDAVEFSFLEKGTYNISFQMKYKNANTAIIRFPQPGATMFLKRRTVLKSLPCDTFTIKLQSPFLLSTTGGQRRRVPWN